MLKRIIKRNGQTEDFFPEKLNNWSKWAGRDLRGRVDWGYLVLEALNGAPEELSSQDLQQRLITACLDQESWPYQLMAGRLFTAMNRKKIYGNYIPTIAQLHEKLLSLGYIEDMGYTQEEYDQIEKMIDHNRDFNLPYFSVKYIDHKYALQNRSTNQAFETPQMVYMRMAMAVHAKRHKTSQVKLEHIKEFYDHLSFNRINSPTPNYNYLGTKKKGLASCCLYTADDDAKSLAIGDHIAYTQTYMAAGIGSNIRCRSIKDPVRSGAIEHQGKLPYYRSLAAAVKANKQGSRGGAATTYFSVYDPEVKTIIMLQNPRTTEDVRNRDIHFAIMTNHFFAKKVKNNETYFTFNRYTAPDLEQAFYSGDPILFENLYNQYEANPNFKKNYLSAREVFGMAGMQFYEVSTLYWLNIDEANRHTPFKEPIYSSNLCAEILQPTQPYKRMQDLYSKDDHQSGEVSLCSIGGIVVSNIEDDAQYESAAYHCLMMIDECIEQADYELPHIEFTAKNRRNAAVGIVGLAVLMARNQQKYDTPEGLQFLHEAAERHYYFVAKAALRLGQEYGNAPWIDKTKWPQGWLPIDTYNKNVDEIAKPTLKYDWEELRQQIIANQGIRFSILVAHMPTESSSKAAGVPNSVYPVRFLSMKKSDGSNIVEWMATDDDLLKDAYQNAYKIALLDQVKFYSVIQKFTDQSISADFYIDRRVDKTIKITDIYRYFLSMVKYGVKSKYYTNSLITDNQDEQDRNVGCSSGACTL